MSQGRPADLGVGVGGPQGVGAGPQDEVDVLTASAVPETIQVGLIPDLPGVDRLGVAVRGQADIDHHAPDRQPAPQEDVFQVDGPLGLPGGGRARVGEGTRNGKVGGKGGANFNPKGKSDSEVMRFCQSFMTELQRHIGENTDVPAGDIGVGAREIGYMFGQYKRLTNEFVGVLTGKGLEFGGSLIRTEATGYGTIYMLDNMLTHAGNSVEGKSVVISGSGNVATYAAQKVKQLGGKVLTMSDSSGFIHDPAGIDEEKLAYIIDLKQVRRGRISEYADKYDATFQEGRPWGVPCDVAVPCATQNELTGDDAAVLLANGCMAVSEGANMPTELSGIKAFQDAGILYAPSKAANAGGVAVSGLEMSQNSARISWKEEELQTLLRDIMKDIHDNCAEHGAENGKVDYLKGANIAGFVKVADAMLAYGVV